MDDVCEVSKKLPLSMLLKVAIISHIVSEDSFLRTPMSKSDFALNLVVLRAVRMLTSAPCPFLAFVSESKPVYNNCIFTPFNDGGEINSTIKTAFFLEIFLALTPTTHNTCPLVPHCLGRSVLGRQS